MSEALPLASPPPPPPPAPPPAFRPNPRLIRRKIFNAVMFSFTALFTLIVIGSLFIILGYLFVKGSHYINWNFFTKLPAPVGESGGGMANAILGSAKILALASAIGLPLGFLAGVFLAEYKAPRFGFVVRYATDLLNGVPSIVMGIFAYSVVVLTTKHFSAWAGGFALGIMMVPIAVRTTEEFLHNVPTSLREASVALGASRFQTIVSIVIPAAMRGIIGGILLDVARVAGETAPLLFTAFGNRFWSHGLNEPTASLPVMIFTYAIGPYDDWHQQAWAAGFILLILVLAFNLSARAILSFRRR